MTATPNPSRGAWKDDGRRVKLNGKGIRADKGAHIVPRTPSFFTHFGDISVANLGFVTHTTGTTGGDAALALAGGNRGTATMATGTDVAAAQTAVVASLPLEPDVDASTGRPIVFEVRAKFDDAFANVLDFTFGLTDSAAQYTNDLTNRISSTSTFTTSAPSDQAVIVGSSIPVSSGSMKASATSTYLGLVSSKAGTDTITIPLNSANYVIKASSPVFDLTAYHTYRVEVNSSGDVAWYIDDVYVGSKAAAVTASVALYGHLNIIAPTGTALTATFDYLLVGGGTSN